MRTVPTELDLEIEYQLAECHAAAVKDDEARRLE